MEITQWGRLEEKVYESREGERESERMQNTVVATCEFQLEME